MLFKQSNFWAVNALREGYPCTHIVIVQSHLNLCFYINTVKCSGLVSLLGDNFLKVISYLINWQLSNSLYQWISYVAHKKMLHHLLLQFCSERLSRLTTLFMTEIRLVEITCDPVDLGVINHAPWQVDRLQ